MNSPSFVHTHVVSAAAAASSAERRSAVAERSARRCSRSACRSLATYLHRAGECRETCGGRGRRAGGAKDGDVRDHGAFVRGDVHHLLHPWRLQRRRVHRRLAARGRRRAGEVSGVEELLEAERLLRHVEGELRGGRWAWGGSGEGRILLQPRGLGWWRLRFAAS